MTSQAQWPLSPVLAGRVIGSYTDLLDFLEEHGFPKCVIVSRETFHVMLRFTGTFLRPQEAVVGNTIYVAGTVFKTADERVEILDLTKDGTSGHAT